MTDTESGEVICRKCGMVISEKTQEMKPRRLLDSAADISKAEQGPNCLASADMGLLLERAIGMLVEIKSNRSVNMTALLTAAAFLETTT